MFNLPDEPNCSAELTVCCWPVSHRGQHAGLNAPWLKVPDSRFASVFLSWCTSNFVLFS